MDTVFLTDISGVLTVLEKSVFTRGYRQLARAVWRGTTFFCDKGPVFIKIMVFRYSCNQWDNQALWNSSSKELSTIKLWTFNVKHINIGGEKRKRDVSDDEW